MKLTRNDLLFTLSLICAIWFAWTGMIWIYFAALIVAYPFGLISLALWMFIRNEQRKRTKFIPALLMLGLVLSITSLVVLSIRG